MQNHSSTTKVNGKSFQDWFIHDYILNEVGMSPLVSGFFWVRSTQASVGLQKSSLGLLSGLLSRSLLFWGCFLKREWSLYVPIQDDVWNPTCNIHDQVKNTCVDMGIGKVGTSSPQLVQLTKDYQTNMKALRGEQTRPKSTRIEPE